MTENADISLDRKSKLLEAAGEVFAERGFREATIREICKKADANIAAVNYHFRDKAGLYHEVLAWCGKVALERHPIGPGGPPGATPQQRLEAFIQGYIERILDTGRPAWHGKLISREMVDPTTALDQLAEHFVKPQYARLSGIVRDLLAFDPPESAPEPVVRRCCFSVVGQCVFMKLCRPMICRIAPQQGYEPCDRAAMAAHIARSSLALIRAAGEAARAEAAASTQHPGGAP